MKSLIYLFLLCFCTSLTAQSNKYLIENRTNLRTNGIIIKQNIVGFTVIHGSEKAEDAELALLEAQLATTDKLSYFPEIDAAMAYYFNLYLKNGNENLLKDLILTYENRVPQEASIAMFNKWKELRSLSKNKDIQVFGIDIPVSYKFYVKLLLELTEKDKYIHDSLSVYWKNLETDYSIGKDTPLKKSLQTLVSQHQSQRSYHDKKINDPDLFTYLMDNIHDSFKDKKQARRDSLITKNYTTLNTIHHFHSSKQFIRMGVYHMMKERFLDIQPGFIASLIESGMYKTSDIYVVQGLLYESKVLWQRTYNENGEYTGYTEESGFYAGETIPGVQELADNGLSDLTFFDLSKEQSPFKQLISLDLGIWKFLPGKSFADYFDGAILIKNSKANVPIESLN